MCTAGGSAYEKRVYGKLAEQSGKQTGSKHLSWYPILVLFKDCIAISYTESLEAVCDESS